MNTKPKPSIQEQNAAIDDLRERYAKTLDLCCDSSIPLWERTHRAMAVYGGLHLDPIPRIWRRRLDLTFRRVNAVLAKHQIDTVQDYQKVPDADHAALQDLLLSIPFAK